MNTLSRKCEYVPAKWPQRALRLALLGLTLLAGQPSGTGAEIALPIVADTTMARVDSLTGTGPHLTLDLYVQRQPIFDPPFYRSQLVLNPTASGVLLANPTTGPVYSFGNVIGGDTSEAIGALRIQLLDQRQEDIHGHGENGGWEFSDPSWLSCSDCMATRVFPKPEFFVGYRFTNDSGVHFGWLRFVYQRTPFEVSLFVIADGAWNPEPNQPIKVGRQPDPHLRHELLPDGLRLSWSPGFAGSILESNSHLGADADWKIENQGPSTEVHVPLSSASRFFRLRRPE